MSTEKKIYLLGKANVGKTSVYNIMTGASNKVANYHGATTKLSKAPALQNKNYTVYDLPGTYSIKGRSVDEQLTSQTLQHADSDSIFVFVLDAVDFEDNLFKISHFISKLSKPSSKLIFAVNMMDEAKENGIALNLERLSKKLNVPFLPLSAKKKTGFEAFLNLLFNEQVKMISHKDLHLNLQDLHTPDYIEKSSSLIFKRMQKADKILTSPFLGPIFFICTMLFLFQAVFSWSAPFMDGIEFLLLRLGQLTSYYVQNIYVKSFFADALIGGLGAFLVFMPQIFILIFIIKWLEESGYLSRASLVCHSFFKIFGLSGESFIPFLSSHACAIPGIYSARHIKSKAVRTLTLLSLPLTVCSAKLPVYSLLITLLVPEKTYLGGLTGARGLSLFSLYALGVGLSLTVSLLLKKTSPAFKTDDSFVMELPRYKWPSLTDCTKSGFKTAINFVKDAGLIIFLTNTVLWFLATFPNGPGALDQSYLSSFGKLLSPLSSPMGLAWPETVSLITAFLARETFVSTLATLYSIDSENLSSLAELMSAKNFSMASTLSLLVFFAIALQCVSTLALLRKELPNPKVATYLFWFYLFLAYSAAIIVHNLTFAI